MYHWLFGMLLVDDNFFFNFFSLTDPCGVFAVPTFCVIYYYISQWNFEFNFESNLIITSNIEIIIYMFIVTSNKVNL